MNKIIYGDGRVNIESTDAIRAFDIKFTGNIDASVLLPSDWIVESRKNRIVGISFGGNLPEGTIFEYKGKLKIDTCAVTTNFLTMNCEIVNNSSNLWEDTNSKFNEFASKPEELNLNYVFDGVKQKTRILHTNLLTLHNQFFYSKGRVVPSGTPYHIHTNPRQVMTGENHTDESVTIYEKLGDGRLFDVRKIKRKTKRKISKKNMKRIVKRLKQNIESGITVKTSKTGADFAQGESAGGGHGGGGSGGY